MAKNRKIKKNILTITIFHTTKTTKWNVHVITNIICHRLC